MFSKLRRAILAVCVFLAGAAPPVPNPNAPFGLPSPAKADPKQREDCLIARPQYVLSYNARNQTPNWVCWKLKKADIGSAAGKKRVFKAGKKRTFKFDPALPAGMRGPRMAKAPSYGRFGFDRGHMCPAEDRSASAADWEATFYITNVVPQSPASNIKCWLGLEKYCRHLAKEGKVLYIACGPVGVGGAGREGLKKKISPEGMKVVTVPQKLWKVVLVLPGAGAQPRKNSRVIAVIMPNDENVGSEWAKYRTSAREVEKLTGLRFFSRLPGGLADSLGDHVDKVEVKGKGKVKVKGKGTDKGTPADVVKVGDHKLTVKANGKETEYMVGKDVKFVGPRGGKRSLKELKAGDKIRIVLEGKTLKEVHFLPKKKVKDKGKKGK
jgi:endonuclease G